MNFAEYPPPFYPPFSIEGFPLTEQPDGHLSKRPRNESLYTPTISLPPLPNPPLNKGTSSIFFKTRMCTKFVIGTCRNGESCKFAHGNDDLRKPPDNWQELVCGKLDDRGVGNWDDDQRIIHKMKLCKKFYNGEECPYGDRCNFLHEDPSKFRNDVKFRESAVINIGTTAAPPELELVEVNKSVYWKTKLCNKFVGTGECPFGDKCLFAHGVADLQLPGQHHQVEKGNNVGAALTKSCTLPASDSPKFTPKASPIQSDPGMPLMKWKGPKKINRIYADWIDDLPLPTDSPLEAEE